MEYKPVQKKNSSWTPTPVQKKGKSPGKMGHSSIQPKSNPSSAPSPEIGEYSRASADRLAANVMRGIQAKELELAEGSTLRLRSGSTLQRKSESPWVSTFDAPPPIPQSPASQLKGAFAPVSENPIQRQCADCAKEEKEQSGEAGKDLEEIGIQTKLTLRLRSGSTIGAPGDTYEQEADRVASQVMSMSAPPDSSASVQRQLDTNHPHHPHQIWQRAQSIKPVVHRQVDPRVQMRQMIQRAHQIDGNQASGDLESRLNASKGGGSPLSENVRGFMEPRFGADFSGVRVHTGGEAIQMNQELGAQAFTHGSDVYFGAGKLPGNNELTAHELTHVVQQAGATRIQREAEPTNHEEMLDQAIAVVEQALNASLTQTTGESDVDTTAAPEAKEQEHGLRTVLEQLRALKGSGKVDEILRVTQPILAAAQGDLEGAKKAQEQQSRQQESSQSSAPTIQRFAQAAAAPPLIAAGPIGWAILGVAAVATVGYAGYMAYESSRSRDRVEPRAVPRTRDREERQNTMRFQVQWGTNQGGPTFSQVATAPSITGVTTVQAITALETAVEKVTPNKAKKAAQPAKAKQIAWISSRPPAGIATAGQSKSAYFRYQKYTDARVDVENLRGHNLKV
ncbi:eCIS core domain-containing protein [Coleofasciculus sp.]|uniref:eCIS core domain-containing protein n=1 Tax=Coleofasciculus sp. TaxID=3100458 RepID=UPI003A221CA1